MNFLRSSPASFLSPASLLQVLIFCCCAVNFFSPAAAPLSAFTHSEMNFLRSSPASFFSSALLLHVAFFSCCGLSLFSSVAIAATGRTRQAAIRSLLIMGLPFCQTYSNRCLFAAPASRNASSLHPLEGFTLLQFCERAFGVP